MGQTVTAEKFDLLMLPKLGSNFERAKKVFEGLGEGLSWDVTNVLLHAVEQGKVDEVLVALEKHYEKDAKLQHPEFRGSKFDAKGRAAFMHIVHDILHLRPTGTPR